MQAGATVKEAKYEFEGTQANKQVSFVLSQSVLGILCVSKDRLFLNFVETKLSEIPP